MRIVFFLKKMFFLLIISVFFIAQVSIGQNVVIPKKVNTQKNVSKQSPSSGPIGIYNPNLKPTITQQQIKFNAKKNLPIYKTNSTTVLTFEGLGDLASIGNYYDGGAGPNYGVSFSSNSLSIISNLSGGSGNFSNEPSPITCLFFLTGSSVMSVPAGFTTGFSFYYTSSASGTVYVWDGVNGGGNLLTSATFSATPNSTSPYYTFDNWQPMGVSFSGTAKSVTFSGVDNQCGFDNITFGSSTPGSGSSTPPADPTSVSVTNSSICNGGSTQLTANGAVGTVYWYTGSCGGTQVGTGSPLTVNPTSTTTYYAMNYNNSLFSAGCASTTITVNPLPVPTISGPASVCYNVAGNVYTTEASMTGYTWNVSGGTITAGGTSTDNTVTVTWNTVGTESVSVNYTNGNSCTAASATVKNVTVHSLPVPTISGPTTMCSSATGNVFTTESGKTSYIWTVPGGTITAGSGTNSITATLIASGAQTVSVNYTDVNGCTAVSPTVYNVTVNGHTPVITGSPNNGYDVNALDHITYCTPLFTGDLYSWSAFGTVTYPSSNRNCINDYLCNPCGVYGAWTIKVTETDPVSGCTATGTKNIFIHTP